MKKFTQGIQAHNIAAIVLMSACSALFFSCEDAKMEEPTTVQPKSKPTPLISYSLVNTFPHDTVSFTEGFLFHEGKLFESSGGMDYLPQSRSAFGIVDLEKGKWDVKAELDKTTFFGEGIVVLKDKIYQVTYHNQTGFVYDAKTFKKINQFNYRNKEGWGLTTDGKYIIMSDGTFNLTYFDPETLQEVKVVAVTESGYGFDHLNELEYIKGFIYANVWMTNNIVKINPETGEVVGRIELDELTIKAKAKNPRSLEMNGIAYDSISDKLLVTGKMWPYIYEIKMPL
jgi:glutaminyl-peptide cyclotransferase